MPKVSFKDTGDFYKVHINDLLNLCIYKEEFIGIKSYINGIEDKAYYIEIAMKSTPILAQYLTKETFEEVLKTLDQNIK
jgi:hypothetical protein